MRQNNTSKIVASIAFVVMIAMQIFGYTGLLQPFSTEDVSETYNTLIYPFTFLLGVVLFVDFLLLLYLLYSFGIIGGEKGELAKQFVVIADVGIMFCFILQSADVYVWHYGMFGISVILRLLILLSLLRISNAYFGNKQHFFWPKGPFDLYLGLMQFFVVSSVATSIYAAYGGDGIFTVNVRAVLLLLTLTILAMTIGLRFLNVGALVAVLLCDGAIAFLHLQTPERYPEVFIAAVLSMAALVAAIIAAMIKRRRS